MSFRNLTFCFSSLALLFPFQEALCIPKPTLEEAQTAYRACVDDPEGGTTGIRSEFIDVIVAHWPEAQNHPHGHLWSPFSRVDVWATQHGDLHTLTPLDPTIGHAPPRTWTTKNSQHRKSLCLKDRAQANLGAPHWNRSLMGLHLGAYLGFAQGSQNREVVPSTPLLIKRLEILNTALTARGLEPIPLGFFAVSGETKIGYKAYLGSFVEKGFLPIATEGYLLHHDRNYHITPQVLAPPEWARQLVRGYSLHYYFSLYLEKQGPIGKSIAKSLRKSSTDQLDSVGNLTDDWINKFETHGYTPNEWDFWNFSSSLIRNQIAGVTQFNDPKATIRKALKSTSPSHFQSLEDRQWFMTHMEEMVQTFEGTYPHLFESYPLALRDAKTTAQVGALFHGRWQELNRVAQEELEKIPQWLESLNRAGAGGSGPHQGP